MVPFWKEALEMVLDVEPGSSLSSFPFLRFLALELKLTAHTYALDCTEDESNRIPDASIVETSAELLYGLVHQRYILTRQGLQAMVRRFLLSQLGRAQADSFIFAFAFSSCR